MSRLCVALLLAVLSASANAEWLLKPRPGNVVSGNAATVDVWQANDTDAPLAEAFPPRLQAIVTTGISQLPVVLEAVDGKGVMEGPLAPGTFRKREFRFTVPSGLNGQMMLTLDASVAGIGVASAVMQADRPAASTQVAVSAAQLKRATQPDTVPQPAITPHEPMYFIVGSSGGATAKFQLSMKYRLLDRDSYLAQYWQPLGKLHFGYTQTSIWDLAEQSSPFRDTSYKPSLFYHEPHLRVSQDGRSNLSLAAGVEHESNGRDGDFSRSINLAFVRPTWQVFFRGDRYFTISPRIYTYLDKKDNAEIDRYRGNVDLNLRYGRSDGWLWSATLRKGSANHGSLLLDASWPLRRRFFADAGGFLHLQYFNGYGETLLDYNRRHAPQWRVGFSIVR
jgi:outer membrane phospholipase A